MPNKMPAGAKIGMLPDAAHAKLVAFEMRADELGALARTAIDLAREERQEATRLRFALDHFGPEKVRVVGDDGQTRLVDSPEVVRVKAMITNAKERRDRHDARAAERGAQHQTQLRLNGAIAALLAENQHSVIAPMLAGEVKTRKGEGIVEAIERVRRRVRELRADLSRVRAAPVFSSVAKDRARTYVDDLAARARPDVFALVERGTEIFWPMLATVPCAPIITPSGYPAAPGGTVHDALGIAALLHRDALVAVLDREIDAVADDASALTDEDRAAKDAEILADLLAVEREEELLIMMAEADGREIARRGDADPRAVLEVVIFQSERFAEAA